MCVFLISQVPIAEPLTSELIDTPVFHNLAPRPIKYRVSVPIPSVQCVNQVHIILTQQDFSVLELIRVAKYIGTVSLQTKAYLYIYYCSKWIEILVFEKSL